MTTNSTETKKSKPVFRKLLPHGISAAVFENEHEGRTYRSINLQRSYRKGNDWKRMTMYIDHDHIPFVIEALQGTWQFLNGEYATPASEPEAEPEDQATEDTSAEA